MNHNIYFHNLCIILQIFNYVTYADMPPNLTSPSGRNRKIKLNKYYETLL